MIKPMDPSYVPEADGVLFEVVVQGRLAQAYVSCALLASLGEVPAGPDEWVRRYERHRQRLDAAVARRAAADQWETVMLRPVDLSDVA